ncbi:MAG TPA: bifunctional demethylmenaquinone methyltransferase/2-methoxy-6-polyprenyl-1,4-benzoquinol methylase UbiE [Syntrophobacteraceae bacterium]|nr:bifunctional demethylmenaquinone methyltransferase/2-methoxy-6-polyprenyl-1,4-benzoquinol methylase UbiE [Syntrophobacteraceae bacterium]
MTKPRVSMTEIPPRPRCVPSEEGPPETGLTPFGYLRVPEEEKVSWVRRHFNTVASRYDFMNTLLSLGTHYIWKRLAVDLMNLGEGDRVLDVCGGTADLSLLAARQVGPTGRVVLYDINWAMMASGRPKVASSPYARNIVYVQGDAESIALESETFDAAMVGFGIRNLTHMERGFREMHRVLRPGGKFMCLEFSEPTPPWFRSLYDFYSFYVMPFLGQVLAGCRHAYTYLPESIRLFPSPDGLKSILEETGFSHVTYRRFTNGIAVVHLGIKG